jgi:hypothetical protein
VQKLMPRSHSQVLRKVVGVPENSNKRTRRIEGLQNPLTHEGAPPDPGYDSNERADDRAEIVEPDGSPSPRAEPSPVGSGDARKHSG